MLTFSDFMKVYEAYTTYAKAAQPITQPVTQPITQPVTQPITQPVTQPITQPVTQPITQPVTQPITQPVTQPITQPVTQPTNADIMAALGALKTPFVNAQTPAQESIDDVICRIAGIQIPKEDQKGVK